MRTLEDGDGGEEDPFDIEHLVDFPVCGLKRSPERSNTHEPVRGGRYMVRKNADAYQPTSFNALK